MVKKALLIGVSQYDGFLNQLPAAVKDIGAVKEVLESHEFGDFDEVATLINPDSQLMREAIEVLFSDCQRNDLILLFFSGHGVKDDYGTLYLTSTKTRKSPQGELVRSTTVSARFVQESMERSRSKRQIVILDCCFSGAFAEGLRARDDTKVDIKSQLGGEGRAVLTSSTSTQYSFEEDREDLSVYTQFLIQGLKSDEVDKDCDGFISVAELHEYVALKVREARPAMKPEIYAVKEGYKIQISKSVSKSRANLIPDFNSVQQRDWKCTFTFTDNRSSVRSVTISSDSEFLVSGGDDFTVKLIDLEKKIIIRSLSSKPKKFRFSAIRPRLGADPEGACFSSVSISPDKKWIAAGTLEGFICLWDANDFDQVRELTKHSDTVYSVAITPNSKFLASGSRDNTVRVWNLDSGECVFVLKGHSNSVHSVAISPDNQTLVSGSRDKTVKIWNLLNGRQINTVGENSDWIRSVAIDDTGNLVASGGEDTTIRLWRIKDGKLIRTFRGHSGRINEISFNSKRNLIVSASDDKTVRIWDVNNGRLLHILTGHLEAVNCIAVTSDAKKIVSGSDEGVIKVWEYI